MARIGKSPEQHARAGNPGRRAPRAVPALSGAASLSPPAWLRDRTALAIWARVAPDLQRVRWLAPITVDVFARWCCHFSEWLACNKILKREGLTIDTPMTGSTPDAPKSMKRTHPILRIRDRTEAKMIELEDRFGLSAMSQLRIAATQSVHGRAILPLFPDHDEAAPDDPAAAAPPSEPAGAFGFLSRPQPLN